MSIETLTTDEFMDLEIADHQEALSQYAATINALSEGLVRLTPGGDAQSALLDRIARHSTLRKVHQVRLLEMLADDAADAAEINGSRLPIAA